MFNFFTDRMAEIVRKDKYVKESEITSTVEETCFVIIPHSYRFTTWPNQE